MSTPRKSTSHTTPSTPRRPCTPENAHGRSPRAPGPPSSPDRRISTSDRPSKSYLRPTVSSTMHHGNSNSYQPRKSIDKPPFLPPSSVGVHSQHHKNPSSAGKSSLSLKGILTRATNAMKSGSDKYRKTSTSASINIGKGSGTSTPVRPRSPATFPKKKDLARSNSVPKKLGVGKKTKERDTMSICSIEDTLPENLPDPVEIAPQTVIQSTVPHVEPQEPSYAENIEDNFVHVEATEGNLIEENHPEIKLEESKESLEVDNDKVAEERQEEQPKIDEDATKTPVETNNVVIGEKQEEEAHEIEPVNVVDEVSQETENVVTVNEEEVEKSEEAVTALPKEPEEIAAVSVEEETKPEEPKESEEEVITIAEKHEATKEEVETQENVEEEKPTVEHETKVEETPIAEENVTSEETPKADENGTAEETPKVEEKPIPTETEEKIEEVVVESPKIEEKPAGTIVSEPKKDKAAIRKPDAVATRREGAISNDVIEETKSKLMEKRKNKVLALVGAFETVMQKPEEGITTR